MPSVAVGPARDMSFNPETRTCIRSSTAKALMPSTVERDCSRGDQYRGLAGSVTSIMRMVLGVVPDPASPPCPIRR